MKFLILQTLSFWVAASLSAPTLLERSSCQLGSVGIGPVSNAGDAACSASV